MEPAAAPTPSAELSRYFAVDEQGTGLRATWRPALGFVNLSLWHSDTCVETFHLTPAQAANLIAFLARGLAASAPSTTPPLRLVDEQPAQPLRRGKRLTAGATASTARQKLAQTLERLVLRLRP